MSHASRSLGCRLRAVDGGYGGGGRWARAVPIRAGRRPPMATGSPPPTTPSARLPPGDPGDPRYALWDTVLDVLGRLCLVAVFSLVACLLLLVVALIVMRYTP